MNGIMQLPSAKAGLVIKLERSLFLAKGRGAIFMEVALKNADTRRINCRAPKTGATKICLEAGMDEVAERRDRSVTGGNRSFDLRLLAAEWATKALKS